MALNFDDMIARQTELSFAAPQHFFITIEKLPDIVYTVQQANVPVISAGEAILSNPFNQTRSVPGDTLDYSQLDVTFLVDKEMKGYRQILKWMKGMINPESFDQFNEYVKENVTSRPDAREPGFLNTMSNMSLFAADADLKPLAEWKFIDAFPISLDGPQYDSTNPQVDYLTATSSFKFMYFEHATYKNGAKNNDII
mgnify:FL=1|tara:strand:- start:440 stop:1030 length:591 start_codon:yes stop_codon:yes gene_type:complete